MAGVPGFEPGIPGSKPGAVTTWPHPNYLAASNPALRDRVHRNRKWRTIHTARDKSF